MRFVERATIPPHRCIVYPQLGSDHEKGYLDPGKDLVGVDPRPYLSVLAIEDTARERGWVPPAEHEEAVAALTDELQELRRRLEMAEQELRETQQFVDAIDVIESRDFRARKKPGRPRKNRDLEEAA